MEMKLEISPKIVGRDAEIDLIQRIYREIRDQPNVPLPKHNHKKTNFRSKSIYVNGLSGTGKSALVEEAFKNLSNGVYFAKGEIVANTDKDLNPLSREPLVCTKEFFWLSIR